MMTLADEEGLSLCWSLARSVFNGWFGALSRSNKISKTLLMLLLETMSQ